MATRLHLRATATPIVSPAFPATWENTASAANRQAATTASGSDTLASTGNITWTAGQDCLARQFVTGPLKGGQTISGTVTAYARAAESNLDDNASTRFGVHVVSADGATVRATLLAVGNYGTSTEYTRVATYTNRRFASAQALTSYTTQTGDRICIGMGHSDVAGTTPGAEIFFGSSSGSDLGANESETANNNPWVEFSADLEFIDGSGIDDVAERGPDTLFFGYSATAGAALATDLSGNATNWTHSTSWIYTANHSEVALQSQFSIEIAALIDSNDSGYLFENLQDTNPTNAIRADGAGDVDFYVAGALMASLDVPSVGATAAQCLIQWSAETNPLTTGSGNLIRHDVRLVNAETNEWTGASFTSAVLTGFDGGSDTTFGAQEPGGSNAFTGTLRTVRLSTHHHTPDEMIACFMETAVEPTLEGVERLEWPVPDVASTLGNDGNFAGPQYLMAARHLRTAQMLLVGPLENEVCTGAWAEDSSWTMDDPDNPGTDMHLEFLRRRPIPPTVNRVIFRVHVQQNGASAANLTVRAYSANAPGPIAHPSQSPDEYVVHSDATTRNADDGAASTGGAWISIGPIRIARDDSGYSYFWLGIATSITDRRVRSWAVEPFFDDASDVAGGGDIGGIIGG